MARVINIYSHFACILFCLSGVLLSQARAGDVYTPKPGSKERKAILDVLRKPYERELKQPVIFQVHRLKVSGKWALLLVKPTRPDQTPIDYSKTEYREWAAEGAFDEVGEALLRLENGQWKVIESRFGATDSATGIWQEKYRFPVELYQ